MVTSIDMKRDEIKLLEAELSIEKVQHRRQSLKQALKVAELELKVLKLENDNARLESGGVAEAMKSKVSHAEFKRYWAQDSILHAAKEMSSRLHRVADRIDVYSENKRYEDLVVIMLTELVHIASNSALESIARNWAELQMMEQILQMASTTDDKEV